MKNEKQTQKNKNWNNISVSKTDVTKFENDSFDNFPNSYIE